MQSKTYNISFNTNYLEHIGNKNSGRYPRGSGENPYQHEKKTTFISGSSKMQDTNSPYYRKSLPKIITKQIENRIKNNNRFIIGDAPGLDSMAQDYLAKRKIKDVTIYTTDKNVRKNADKSGKLGWSIKYIDGQGLEEGSKEWRALKDIAMSKDADDGIAVVLENGGASATRANVDRLINNNKSVNVIELRADKFDSIVNIKDIINSNKKIKIKNIN